MTNPTSPEEALGDLRERILRDFPMAEALRLVDRHRRTRFGRHKQAYLRLDRALKRVIEDALHFGLAKPGRKRILDVGTGPGFGAYVLSKLGHDVVATEAYDNESLMWSWWKATSSTKARINRLMSPDERRCWLRSRSSLYGDFVQLLGVDRQVWTVRGGESAPELGKFDVLLAAGFYFDHQGQDMVWSEEDWGFFFNDVSQRLLNPGGCINLSCFSPRPLLERLIENAGGLVDRSRDPVRITLSRVSREPI